MNLADFYRILGLINRLIENQIFVHHDRGGVAGVFVLFLAEVNLLKLLVLSFQKYIPLLEDAPVFLVGLLRTSSFDFLKLGDSDLLDALCPIFYESFSILVIASIYGRHRGLKNFLRRVDLRDVLLLRSPKGTQTTYRFGV